MNSLTLRLRENRIVFRNKIVSCLNGHSWLGCKVHAGMFSKFKKYDKYLWRFVMGTAKDGRTILIWPMMLRSERVPKPVRAIMRELADKGAIVGCALSLSDAVCIVVDKECDCKRSQQSYAYRNKLRRHGESDDAGSPETQNGTP